MTLPVPSRPKRVAIFALFAVVFTTNCQEESFPVTECSPHQGYDFDTAGVPVFGRMEAPITVDLFVDFQCPYSKEMARRVFAFLGELQFAATQNAVNVYIRHFPSPIHDRAMPAALAAAAAFRQGNTAFFRFFPYLFKQGIDLTDAKILQYADLADLDLNAFETDLVRPETQATVDRDFKLAIASGFNATPAVVICGTRVEAFPDEVVDNLSYLVDRLGPQ